MLGLVAKHCPTAPSAPGTTPPQQVSSSSTASGSSDPRNSTAGQGGGANRRAASLPPAKEKARVSFAATSAMPPRLHPGQWECK
eukprot:787842-Alexandrium_andersonii.AAC.1